MLVVVGGKTGKRLLFGGGDDIIRCQVGECFAYR